MSLFTLANNPIFWKHETFYWILGSGILMSFFALSGSLALLLNEKALKKMILPLVAFSAGSLIGGAFFHMIPEAVESCHMKLHDVSFWVIIGFITFFALEQFFHWHHCHRQDTDCMDRKPLTYLILLGDGVHNLLGGFAVTIAFTEDIRLGLTTWFMMVAHEIPQELGDFGVLIHGGWTKKKALLLNFISALTFPIGGVLAYFLQGHLKIDFLFPFAAGNFIYIAASDLVPEINKHHSIKTNIIHFVAFILGIFLLYQIHLLAGPHHHHH